MTFVVQLREDFRFWGMHGAKKKKQNVTVIFKHFLLFSLNNNNIM